MTPRQAKKFRKDRAGELRSLATVLQEAGLVRDAGPLLRAAGQCGDRNDFSWGYEFAGLEFDLRDNELRHTKPNGAELDSIELAVSLSSLCLDKDAEDDPFTKLNVDIVVNGLDTDANELKTAWHLDKHEGGDSKFHHPNYHFHYGGKRIWESVASQGFSYGSLLLLESPRLDHKPLDGILAVDFVLANFSGPAWQALKAGDGRYAELTREAEKWCHFAYASTALARLKGQG